MILDKFILLFETDASEATKDTNDYNKELKATEKTAESLVNTLKDLVSAYLALSVIKSTVIDVAAMTDATGKFSKVLGFNIEEVDAWGAAVTRNGGSADSFRGSISALNDQLTELSLNGGSAAAETLARLGINATDSKGKLKGVFDLLPELADSFQKISKQESFGLGKRLGLDQGTILLLQQGRVAVDDLVEKQRQLGGATESSYKASAEFNDEVNNTGRVLQAVAQDSGKLFLPFLSSMLRGLQSIIDWMREHKDFMTGFFVAVATAITVALVPALKLLAATIKASPIARMAALVGALATAFAALYEDVKAYMNGQDSFIGKLFEKYKWLENGIRGFIDIVLKAWEEISNINWIELLVTGPIEALNQLRTAFLDMWNYIVNLFDFDKLFDFNLPSWMGGSGNSDIAENTQKGLQTHDSYASNPVNTMSSSLMFNTTQTRRSIDISMGEINVDARGMDQNQARGLINKEFSSQLANAIGELDDGVDR